MSCEICLISVRGNNNLLRHLELIHFPDKTRCPYGCPDMIEDENEWLLHLEGCKSDKLVISWQFSSYRVALF